MDGDIQALRRKIAREPENAALHLRLIHTLKREARPFLEEAIAARLIGVPFGEDGVDRAWFTELWRPIRYRANRMDFPELVGGPFCSLKGRDLRLAELRGCDMAGASLRRTELDDADLAGADLRGSVLRNASGDGANMIRIRARGADLSWGNWTRVDFIDADLRGVDFRGAFLDRANLRGADLRGADFRGASLASAKIEPWPRGEVLTDENTVWPDGLRDQERRRAS